LAADDGVRDHGSLHSSPVLATPSVKQGATRAQIVKLDRIEDDGVAVGEQT